MRKEDAVLLSQLVESLRSNVKDFEKAYEQKDLENFTRLKKEILEIQRKIDAVVR